MSKNITFKFVNKNQVYQSKVKPQVTEGDIVFVQDTKAIWLNGVNYGIGDIKASLMDVLKNPNENNDLITLLTNTLPLASDTQKGLMSAEHKKAVDAIIANNGVINPATEDNYGGVKLGYQDSTPTSKKYPLVLDQYGKAYVEVPWVDTNTEYSAGQGLTLSGTTFALGDLSNVYASISHTHTLADITDFDVFKQEYNNTLDDYAETTSASLNDLNIRVNGLKQDITNTKNSLSEYAKDKHTHSKSDITNITSLVKQGTNINLSVEEKKKEVTINAIVDNTNVNPLIKTYIENPTNTTNVTIDWSKVSNKPVNATSTKEGFMSATDKAKLDGIAANANNYVHPSYTAQNEGLYKISVDNLGHVKTTKAVATSDITPLLNGTYATKSSVDEINNKIGKPNGIAILDETGRIPNVQIAGAQSDVSTHDTKAAFPQTGETNKIYISKDDNKTYRWAGSGYVEISPSLAIGTTANTAYAGNLGAALDTKVNNHVGNISNPHNVTKAQVGLGNVDNTSDANKPVSTLQQQAIDKAKSDAIAQSGNAINTLTSKVDADIQKLSDHETNKNNPHGVTKAQVGLGNVNNTADSTKNVLSATKLTTPRNISGVPFDGTKNIDIPFSGITNKPTTLAGYGITDASKAVHTHTISQITDLALGYTTNGKNYAVQKGSDNKLFVNVPWQSASVDSATVGPIISEYLNTHGVSVNWNEVQNKPTTFTPAAHNHDTVYSKLNHTHTEYALKEHTHTGYAASTHNHDTEYAPVSHTHTTSEIDDFRYKVIEYAPTPTWSDIQNKPSSFTPAAHNHDTVYAKLSHTHTASQITDFRAKVIEYAPTPTPYVLPTASSTVKGGITLGYTASGKNYPLQLDNSGKAYVNVPWTNTDTNTTYSAGSGLVLSGTTFSVGDLSATYARTNHTHTGYAASTHNHDTVYSKLNHTHTGYAPVSHTHTAANISDFNAKVNSLVDKKLASVSSSNWSASTNSLIPKTDSATLIISTQGTMKAAKGFYEESDIRLKNVKRTYSDNDSIKELEEKLSKISTIDFTWKKEKDNENKKTDIGLIAQEVESQFPSLVNESEEGIKSVDYAKMVSVLIPIVNRLVKRVEELESKI